jgi:hypothetical protein
MKNMKIAGLILISLMFAANSLAQTGSTETLTVPLSSPGKPYTLKVQLVSGSIKITGYDGKDVIINVTPVKDDEDNDQKAAENGMKRISSHGGFAVTVNTGSPEKAINLEMKVPQDVKLIAGTVNDGPVTIENLRGELEVNNVNDEIVLTGISGSVVANTVNGDVKVTFKTVDPKAPMAFSTLNGDVTVTLPADTKANLKLKSDNGDVYSDFDIDIDKTPSKVDKTTEPGLYKIKKDDWINGKINGGGQEMMMKNMQVDIYVKKASK